MSEFGDAARELRAHAARLLELADSMIAAADKLTGDAPKLTAEDVEAAAAAAAVPGTPVFAGPGPLPTDREYQLVLLVTEHGAVTPGFAAERLGCEQSGISRLARIPVQCGWIEARGATKSRHYCIPGWTGKASEAAGRLALPRVIPADPDMAPDEDLRRRVRLILSTSGPATEGTLAARLSIPQLELRRRLAALVADLVVRVDREGRYVLLASDSHRSDMAA